MRSFKSALCYVMLSGVFLFNCDDDKENFTTLLKVSVGPSEITSESDDWIVVHDDQGVLIDYKSFESGEAFEIRSSKITDGMIGVTHVQCVVSGTQKSYLVKSFLNVQPGETLTLNGRPKIRGTVSEGTFKIKFNYTYLDHLDQFFISNRFNNSCGSLDGDIECAIRKDAPDFLLQASDMYGMHKYKIFENPKPGEFYNVSWDDLEKFDKYAAFTFPKSNNVYCYVEALNEDGTPGYLTNFHITGDEHTSYTIGYLNRFANYSTHLTVWLSNYYVFYNKEGGVPTMDFNWPTKDQFSISSGAIDNFSSSATVPFARRYSSWIFQERTPDSNVLVYWYVSSSTTSQRFESMPQEILSIHPALDFKTLRHLETSFYTMAQPYDEFISATFQLKTFVPATEVGIKFNK